MVCIANAAGRVALALVLGAGGAEALTYSWKPSTAAYAPVTGTSVIFSGADDGSVSLSLPFPFVYDSTSYTTIGVNSNGMLSFGTALTTAVNGNLFSASASPFNVLAPWWDDMIDDAMAEVQTSVEGTAPNQVFIIQYSEYPDYRSAAAMRLNWQVRLYQGGNRILFAYGNKSGGASSASSSASLGIKGRNGLPGFYIEGTMGSRTVPNAGLNSNTGFPAAGTVFAFAPDTAAPLGLTATPAPGRADLSWRRTRLTSLLRYRIWAGTSPTSMTLRDSTADTTFSLTGLVNGTAYYVGVTVVGPGLEESGFAQVVSVTPTQPPTVSIASPADGARINYPANQTLTALASDPDGTIVSVSFYRAGTILIGTVTGTGPHSITWSFPPAGTHLLTARAVDNHGAMDTSEAVTLTVNAAPAVSLTAPLSGARFLPGDPIPIRANATDAGTVVRVEFYQGAVRLGEDLTAPYEFTWTGAPAGVHSLTARATDNDGAIGISSTVSVTVTQPPTVRFAGPPDGSAWGYPGTVTLTANASDPDGTVSRVDYYRNGSFLGSVTSGNPYAFTWTLPISSGTQILSARVFDNTGAEGRPDTVRIALSGGPVVALTTPVHFAAYPTSGSISMSATASDPDGSISEVRFYRDSILIGADASAPYDLTWSDAPKGRYRIQARAVDNLGVVGYSQAVTVFVNDSAKAIPGGRVFITGHDADFHRNVEFISAGLNYLTLGHSPSGAELPICAGARIAFLGNNPPPALAFARYPSATFIDLDNANWETLAFEGLHYDILIVGTFDYYVSGTGSTALNQRRSRFDEYFNKGGGIFAMSEFGHGPTYYDFLPAFGTAMERNIGGVSGRFTATPPGLAIGLTEDIVDRDLTHTEFLDLSDVFQVFETFNDDNQAISIGANAAIEDGGFVPADSVTANPVALARDSVFADTLCVRFSSPSPGASIHITANGGNPDTSTWVLANGGMVCIDKSTTFRAIAKKAGWVNSADTSFFFRNVGQVVMPLPDSLPGYFRDRICVRFTSATPGARILYTLDGGRPDTSGLSIPNGDPVCLDASRVIRVMGRMTGMRDSDTASYAYTRMEKSATPTLNKPDSTRFPGSLCFRFSAATPGSHIRYTLDGGDPDTAGTHAHDGDSLCVDRSVSVRLFAEQPGFLPSDENAYRYFRMEKVAAPVASRIDSTWFADTLCVRFSTATDSATLRYLTGPGRADTSSLVLGKNQDLCLDRGAVVRVAATRPGWLPSDEAVLRFFKMDTVARPVPEPGDSTYFPGSICVRWTVATPGAVIRFTTDGSRPDSSSRMMSSGDTVCLDRTATIKARGMKPDWIPSPETAAAYSRMLRAAKPVPDKADSLHFPDRVCIRYSSATEGARIRYTLDGGRADTSGLSIANGDTLCVDRSVRIEAAAAHKNWITSEESVLQVFRMETVAVPVADVPDSTWFRDSLCVPWTTATAGAAITVRRTAPDPGGKPGRAADSLLDGAGKPLVSGDSVCLDRSATLRAVGSLKDWMDSPEAVRDYFRMDTVAKPVFDRRDTLFHPSICVQVSTPTPGADIRYTLDGGDPNASRLVKRSGDTICTDRSVAIRAVGERIHSVPSGEASLNLTRMPQVASLRSSIGVSAVFARRICFTLSSSTDSVRIRYTLDGGDPLEDTLSMANGDSLCLDRSADVVAVGTRPLWLHSETFRVSLEIDNDGPRLVSAEKRPYEIRSGSVTGNCRGIGQDTLVVTFSEPLFPKSKPPRWDRLLVFSPSCDSGQGLPVLPFGAPVISADGLKATVLMDNASPDEKPKLGNCLSLDWRSREFHDHVGNLPERQGIRIEGRENAVRISQIRAYPPVVGLDNAGSSGGCTDERVEINTWIPPVGFDIVHGEIDPDAVRNCLNEGGEGTGRRTAIPPCLSIVEVVSDGPYTADISIFDNLGTFIHGSRQGFGACGELDNLERSVGGKQRSYLVWNSRDRKGALAGNGVYVWRMAFHSEKHGLRGTQTVLLRTGILRNGACPE